MNTSPNKDERRMYGDLAWLWPIISPPEDYFEETELFSKAIKENSRIEVKTLLHMGCGGGHNDHTFKKYFNVTGVDTSEEMLKLARTLNPEVTYHEGDMRTVRLSHSFDAVAILDSITYMSTVEDLRSAFQTAYEHLKPGGIFITYVEECKERFMQNRTKCSSNAKGDIEITLIENSYDPDPADTSFEGTFIFLIRQGGELQFHTDHHICGLFELGTWHDLLRESGFEVEQMKFEHSTFPEGEQLPLLVCTKPF